MIFKPPSKNQVFFYSLFKCVSSEGRFWTFFFFFVSLIIRISPLKKKKNSQVYLNFSVIIIVIIIIIYWYYLGDKKQNDIFIWCYGKTTFARFEWHRKYLVLPLKLIFSIRNSRTNLLNITWPVSLLLRTDKFTLFILYFFLFYFLFFFWRLKRIHAFLCRLVFCFLIHLSFSLHCPNFVGLYCKLTPFFNSSL